MEALSLGFRTREGVDLERLRKQYCWDLTGDKEKAILSQMGKDGLLKIEKNCLRATRKGFLFADSLPVYLFFPAPGNQKEKNNGDFLKIKR